MHDFSSLQARSSMNLQQFYKNMRSAYDKYLETVSPITASEGLVPLEQLPNNNLKKNLERYKKKIDRAKEKLVRSINSNPKLRDKILGELKQPSENVKKLVKSAADDVFSALDPAIKFVDPVTGEPVNRSADVLFMFIEQALLSVAGAGSAAGVAIAVSASGIAAGAVAGVLGAFGIGITAVMAALVIFAFLDKEHFFERSKVISNKKYIMRIHDDAKNVIKCMNDSAKFTKEFIKKNPSNASKNDPADEYEIPNEVYEIFDKFLDSQKKLWGPYTTAEGREYFEPFKRKHGKHLTGFRSVSDNKQSTEIGRCKIALANTWKKMQLIKPNK